MTTSTENLPDNLADRHAALTGLILAGGQGSRMGGVDKGWVEYQQRPLIEHAIATLAPQVGQLMISANRELPRYQALNYPVVLDIIDGFAGPLAGLHAGLSAAKTDWVISLPVDSPHVPAEYVSRMLDCQQAEQVDVVFASDGEFPQPVFLLMRTSLAASMQQMLAAGDGKIMRWVKQQKYAECVFTDARMFENKNRPEDLAL